MKLVHLKDMTPDLWYHAWNAMFDPFLGDHMGVNPQLIAAKPSIEDFYRNVLAAHEAERLEAWAIVRDGKFVGYTTLDKSVGEWENATVLADPKLWGSGMGVYATFHAFHWAFEVDGAEWVVAFTQGKDPRVARMHEKINYRRLMNFWVLDRGTWEADLRAKYERLKRRYEEIPDGS